MSIGEAHEEKAGEEEKKEGHLIPAILVAPSTLCSKSHLVSFFRTTIYLIF